MGMISPNIKRIDGRSSFMLLDYMTMAILPKHLLEGENMQESDFFRAPEII